MRPLPEADHVARYCKPSTIDERGQPMANAFAMRAREDHLSVNWLEHFDPQPDVAIHHVRNTLRASGFQLRPNGRFALLGVAAIKSTVKRSLGLRLHVNHLPLEHDPSHAGVLGYSDADLMVAAEIRSLVGPGDLRRAV
ncbi:MAG: hypothetical protein F4X98_09045 [Gammaproteobacteria bacterium]|nr:hypothetical protein [Gammaproteobacteria bacterium]